MAIPGGSKDYSQPGTSTDYESSDSKKMQVDKEKATSAKVSGHTVSKPLEQGQSAVSSSEETKVRDQPVEEKKVADVTSGKYRVTEKRMDPGKLIEACNERRLAGLADYLEEHKITGVNLIFDSGEENGGLITLLELMMMHKFDDIAVWLLNHNTDPTEVLNGFVKKEFGNLLFCSLRLRLPESFKYLVHSKKFDLSSISP